MTGAHKQEPGSRLVGEREERLREALERIAERTVFPIADPTGRIQNLNHIARAALAFSPSPPDREQAVEQAARLIFHRERGEFEPWDRLANETKNWFRGTAERVLFGPPPRGDES